MDSRPNKPKARDSKSAYRRNLPHYQGRGGPIFATFCTLDRWILPGPARALVLKHSLHDHMKKCEMICVVVMPDHVHLLYRPWEDEEDRRYALAEIIGDIKSVSAHSINKLLGRKGSVWQDESFDHVTRCWESIEAKAQYIVENPVRKGLCKTPDEYPWLWRNWKEGSPAPSA